jgi:competence protein ComEC
MKRGVYIFWSLCIAAALVRLWGSFDGTRPDLTECLKQEVHGTGILVDEPERKETGQVFVVKVGEMNTGNELEEKSCATGILIRMKTKLYPRLQFGESVAFSGKVSKPFNFRSDSGREFNYEGFLAKDNVFYEIKSATVEKIADATGAGLSGRLYSLKRGFVGNLEHALGDPHAALAAGLVVGEKSALGKDLLEQFRMVGLIHIIVLSGYNITIVADALRKILSFLPRVWGIMIGWIGIALFGILVGGGATVVRSCFMASVALSGDLIRRDYSALRALIFAGLLMLIQNPLILFYDPSFQLSFLATLGLIMLASPIESKLPFITEKFGVRGIVASTLATQVFVSPYILYMMGNLSIIGMIVNILVLPLIPLTMLCVFLTGAIGFLAPTISLGFGWVSHLLLSYELFMVEKFAQVPFAAIEVPPFSGWVVTTFYGCLIVGHVTLIAGRKIWENHNRKKLI